MVIQFTGKGVGNVFKHEAGKHTVQRVPPTETRGRAQTSVVSVATLPLFKFNDKELPMSDVDIDTKRGSGPGGQHRNKTDSAVLAVHKPTGLQVYIDGRKQHQNKKKALRILTAKVNQQREERTRARHDKQRKNQMGGGSRSGKTRTYNFMKKRVIDHQLGTKTNQVDKIMKGQFDLILKKG